ncbi:MAG: DNA-binding protein WhiA [Oscillospiraceae bacterium]|nr:DNA-binding protein WhiA [Oscillospiraceae bacterium]
MSFSANVKTEMCRDGLQKKCCALAEAYGVLLYCNLFTLRHIRILTANDAFSRRLPRLFRRAFGVTFDELPPEDKSGKRTFSITDPEKIRAVFAAVGYDPERIVVHHLNLASVENDCDRAAFLRGAFLAGGSVIDPLKRYHLELVTSHAGVSRQTRALLQEMGFEPKDTLRGASSVIYFKQSAAIEDLLTTMGAPLSAMELMQAKVEKHMANAMNRLTNCDMANADKITDAARDQLEAIRAIEAGPGLESLPPLLQDTALLRIANPSCSLSDLSQLASPPVTKSCMNHRLRKLMEISGDLKKTGK